MIRCIVYVYVVVVLTVFVGSVLSYYMVNKLYSNWMCNGYDLHSRDECRTLYILRSIQAYIMFVSAIALSYTLFLIIKQTRRR